MVMATESFLKDVTMKKSSSKRNLILALESAHKKTSKNITIGRTVQKISRDKLRDFLGEV